MDCTTLESPGRSAESLLVGTRMPESEGEPRHAERVDDGPVPRGDEGILASLLANPKEGNGKEDSSSKFVPRQPRSLEEAGLLLEDVEKLVCKFLLARGAHAGRKIAEHIGLPFGLLEALLRQLQC